LKKLRISIVQYLNTAPLVWGFTHGPLQGKYDLSFTVPSQCAEALRSDAADIAIIPAIEYQRIPDLVALPDLAIASKHRVRSLLLIAKKPIEQVRRIALDRSSRSTQALTRILCAEHWKITPEFAEADPDLGAMLQNADAALLIGDPALRMSVAIESAAQRGVAGEQICAGSSIGFAGAQSVHVYDIVEQWRRMTNLPAVLAIWAGHPEKVTADVCADFIASCEDGLRHIPDICSNSAREMHLPEAQLRLYLERNIDYSLDDENRKGLSAYFRYSKSLGLIDSLRTLVIASRDNAASRTKDTVGEDEKNRYAAAAHNRFLRSGAAIKDVYGKLSK
jgi:chorismate dehydratase